MTSRRRFLTSALAATLIPQLSWADAGAPSYLAAAFEPDGGFALFGLSDNGTREFRIPLPGRGHAAAAHPHAPEAVAFARRPGLFALVIDCVQGQITHQIHAPKGRHFYGHGAFIAGGDILCTTENDITTGAGRIGLWSRKDGYVRIGDFASGGIGPHDLLRLDGDVLVVANGGIRTDPARGREKLNLDSMQPNLSYLSTSGELLERVELPPDMHQNSIRHLAAAADGTLAFAMQWQGDVADPVPLLGLHNRGGPAILAKADLAESLAMQGYAGSIAFDPTGTTVAITSPRGGRVQIYDRQGNLHAVQRRADVCGIATRPTGGFAVTDGLGGIWSLSGDTMKVTGKANLAWDNHLIAIS